MTSDLDRIAAGCGLMRSYHAIDGRLMTAPDEAVVALLRALGVDPDHPGPPIRAVATPDTPPRAPDDASCYVPDFLVDGRAWGVTCQLYSLRSSRNWGIGDFEDLACLGETVARFGADFLGVNPLHALFIADPDAASPFYPADRNFLNPLYIAVDRLPGFDTITDATPDSVARLREGAVVDYRLVATLKLAVLRRLFANGADAGPGGDLAAFIAEGGEALQRFALFQAISMEMVANGMGAGWHSWPVEMRDPDSPAVIRFASERRAEVEFQIWLQCIADRQLAEAGRRLRAAGMRIGLYLDLAVGTAPDGAATWSDRSLAVVGAEIGAPPDMFNPAGQKWGLAPVSPTEIATRRFTPVRQAYRSILKHAGALRIDHAMSLYRLFWIPTGHPALDGVYALYPMTDIVRILAEVSQAYRALIIGEDLGVVPAGFRDEMQRANLLGYRIFYFERNEAGFIPPEQWSRNALACVGSHDTPTLAGWWQGTDIDERGRIGFSGNPAAEREARYRDRDEVMAALRARGHHEVGAEFSVAVAVGVHDLVARSPARLVAVQLEDLLGVVEQTNIPGTVQEHPNWRRRLPVAIEDFEGQPLFTAVLGTVAQRRPRTP